MNNLDLKHTKYDANKETFQFLVNYARQNLNFSKNKISCTTACTTQTIIVNDMAFE
jgi:hypothetical protein